MKLSHHLLKPQESVGTSSQPQVTREGDEKNVEPGSTPHHSDKWRSCVDDVNKKGSASDPYAVCTAQLGPSIEDQIKNSPFKQAGTLGSLLLEATRPGLRAKRLKEKNTREAASMLTRGGSGTLTLKPIKSEKDAASLQKEIQDAYDEAQKRYQENQLDQHNHMRVYQMKQLYNKAQTAIKIFRDGQKKKESKKASPSSLKESSRMNVSGRFLETLAGQTTLDEGKRFRVVLLQEGMGNMSDCFYYTKPALQSAIPLFEGVQFYVNHPSQSEDVDRPERDVRDVAGYFENVGVEDQQDGRSQLKGDLCLVDGNAFDRERSLMVESISYSKKHPGKDLVGLSINANGDFSEQNLMQFMQQMAIPESCKVKLVEAMERGVETIRPVSVMTSAVSCDLVTVAGAGGRINQLLEKEKSMEDEAKQKKEAKHHEDEKMKQKKEDGADGDGDAGPQGDHDDAQQDIELIKTMMKKYLGDGFSDDDHQMAQEALKHAKDMGMDEDEAMKCAGYNLKMAKHIQSKMAKQPPMAPDHDGKDGQPQEKGLDGALDVKSPDPVKGSHPGASQKGLHEKEDESKEDEKGVKESAKLVRITAENARLRAELDKTNLEKHIDKVLRESRMPNSATKKFRDVLGEAKTQDEVNQKLKMFKEAYSFAGESDGLGFIIGAEKTTTGGAGLSFADCVEED